MRNGLLHGLISILLISLPLAHAGDPPRIVYLCSRCDHYGMAAAEDSLTKAAKENGIGVIKVGNSSSHSAYGKYFESHPESAGSGLTKIKPVGLSYDWESFPNSETDRDARWKEFKEKKAIWANQFLEQFKKLDKTKPIVLYFGNHGLSPDGKNAKDVSPVCMFTEPNSLSQCLTYGELGDMLEKAGLTGKNAPPIRVIGDHCYGGGAHHLSMRFPNVCSASIVSAKEVQSGGNIEYVDFEDTLVFGQTFWKTVRQEGPANSSLANSFQTAWATVPKSAHPGGTLSSIYYAQQIMGWQEDKLPTDVRLPSLQSMEKSSVAVEGLFGRTQEDIQNFKSIDQLEKPEYSCKRDDFNIAPQTAKLEKLVKSLTLDQGANLYRDAVRKASEPSFIKNGKAALAAIDSCWATAKSKYEKADAKVKNSIETNGSWAWKNILRSERTVNAENRKAELTEAETLANQVLKNLAKCVDEKQSAAREYLTVIQTLKTLERLASFADVATPAQKEAFRKKVECESSPLF